MNKGTRIVKGVKLRPMRCESCGAPVLMDKLCGICKKKINKAYVSIAHAILNKGGQV